MLPVYYVPVAQPRENVAINPNLHDAGPSNPANQPASICKFQSNSIEPSVCFTVHFVSQKHCKGLIKF